MLPGEITSSLLRGACSRKSALAAVLAVAISSGVAGEETQSGGEALDNAPAQSENAAVAVAGRQRGTHMGFARMLATIVFIVALPVALLTTNIRLLANAPLTYSYAFDRYHAEDTTGLSRADLDASARALRGYLNDGEDAFYFEVTEDGLKTPIFNARETRHMQDVKDLFGWVNRAQEMSLVYVLAYVVAFFIWARDGIVRQLAVQSLIGVGVGLLAVGTVGVLAATGFDAAWTRFHEIAFPGGGFRFDPDTDHLIQMFPEAFWRDMVIFLGIISAVEAAVIAAVASVYLLGSRGERTRLAASIDVHASTTQAA
jgi:integral membrane protein (TIGR01906 family)